MILTLASRNDVLAIESFCDSIGHPYVYAAYTSQYHAPLSTFRLAFDLGDLRWTILLIGAMSAIIPFMPALTASALLVAANSHI